MGAANLIRTGSIPAQHQSRPVLRRTYSTAAAASYQRSSLRSAKKSSSAAANETTLVSRQALSDTNLVGTNRSIRVSVSELTAEEVECSGGGMGRSGRKVGGGRGDGRQSNGGGKDRRVREYYQEMIRTDPGNPLLLRNYANFLHEVEGDTEAAEEYYARAILASPGDGEVLSMYGKLVWENHRDEHRAEAYFERAVEASPDDCYVLGSYAQFLWDAEDDEEEKAAPAPPTSHLVEAL